MKITSILNPPHLCHTCTHWQPSTTTVFYWRTLGSGQYNHSLLLADTGSWPVQPQSSTGGYWELASTTTVFYWRILGAGQYNQCLLLADSVPDLGEGMDFFRQLVAVVGQLT